MQMAKLPKTNQVSLIGLRVLIVLLIVTILYITIISTIDLQRFNPGAAFWTASESLLLTRASGIVWKLPNLGAGSAPHDPGYLNSLIDQTKIVAACDAFVARTGRTPQSFTELEIPHNSGLSRADPWGRAYILRSSGNSPCIIQSSGPSGEDKLRQLSTEQILRFPQRKQFYVADNLIVVGGPKP